MKDFSEVKHLQKVSAKLKLFDLILMNKCPNCGSKNIKLHNYLNIKTLKCNNCGFDEGSIYEVYPEQKTSQKAKGKYAVYKTGGGRRTSKK